MKVLQINCVYNQGSTGKIMTDIHTQLLDDGIQSVICYGRGKNNCVPGVYKTSHEIIAKYNNLKSRFTGITYGGSFLSTNKLQNIIKREAPDVVHLHCINGFFVNVYRLVNFLKKNNIPVVVTHHAEFLYTGNCAHAFECDKWKTGCGSCPNVKRAINSYFFDFTRYNYNLMKKAFNGFKKLCSVSVSPWEQSREQMSAILEKAVHTTIFNGVDCDIFHERTDYSDLKKSLNIICDKKIILHVTANFDDQDKGGKYIIELAKSMQSSAIVLIVGSRKRIENCPPNVIDVGRVENQNILAQYYSMADLTVIASKRETFSMPVAESLCCGTPVIGFKAGGPETIAIDEYCRFVEYGDSPALLKAASEMIDYKCRFLHNEISLKASKKYSKERMYSEYLKIYKDLSNCN